MAQDRRLQRPQLRRGLDREAVDEREARVAVLRQRLGLPALAVQGEHPLRAQALPQRVLADERLQLAGQPGVAAAREVGVDALAQAGEAEVVEARGLREGEALVADVRERRAAPHGQRLAERLRRLPRGGARQLRRPLPVALLEAVGVDVGGRDRQHVAAAPRDHGALTERRAQARGQHLHGVAPVPRRLFRPQLVERAVGRDQRPAVDQEQSEERQDPPLRHGRAPAAFQLDLERPEDREAALHGPTLPPARPPRERSLKARAGSVVLCAPVAL